MLRAMRRAFFALLLCLACAPGAVAAPDPVFTVAGVEVDVEADSAVVAQEQAFARAQREALKILLGRLADSGAPPVPEDVDAFIADAEVTGEQFSDTRYVGTYTFRFRPEAVRAYLEARGAAYTDVAGAPVLVLPLYQAGGAAPVLWARDNPWMAAWRRADVGRPGALVPVVVPLGDVDDVRAVPDARGLDYDPGALDTMVGRYRAGEAAVALAAPGPSGLEVHLYRTDSLGPHYTRTLDVPGGDWDAAVRAVGQALASDWKTQMAVVPGRGAPESELRAVVPIESLEDWVAVQGALERLDAGVAARVLALTVQGAEVALTFPGGDTARARAALERAGLALVATGEPGLAGPAYEIRLTPTGAGAW
jgi:hypothetical protein